MFQLSCTAASIEEPCVLTNYAQQTGNENPGQLDGRSEGLFEDEQEEEGEAERKGRLRPTGPGRVRLKYFAAFFNFVHISLFVNNRVPSLISLQLWPFVFEWK